MISLRTSSNELTYVGRFITEHLKISIPYKNTTLIDTKPDNSLCIYLDRLTMPTMQPDKFGSYGDDHLMFSVKDRAKIAARVQCIYRKHGDHAGYPSAYTLTYNNGDVHMVAPEQDVHEYGKPIVINKHDGLLRFFYAPRQYTTRDILYNNFDICCKNRPSSNAIQPRTMNGVGTGDKPIIVCIKDREIISAPLQRKLIINRKRSYGVTNMLCKQMTELQSMTRFLFSKQIEESSGIYEFYSKMRTLLDLTEDPKPTRTRADFFDSLKHGDIAGKVRTLSCYS